MISMIGQGQGLTRPVSSETDFRGDERHLLSPDDQFTP